MSKVVKNIYTGTLYQKWTEVSDFLVCGLVGVMVKNKSELTEEELKELKMSKKITLTVEELEHEIKQAFVHGQSNSIMMEAGLERNERKDYTSSVMRRLTKQKEDE